MISTIFLSFFPHRIKGENYVESIKRMLDVIIIRNHIKASTKDMTLKDMLLMYCGICGYISTETFTSTFSHAKIASLRTIINEMIKDGLLDQLKLSAYSKHGDGMVNSLYSLTSKGKRKLKSFWPEYDAEEIACNRRTALHTYYNSYVVRSAMYRMKCKAFREFNDGIHFKTNDRGYEYASDVLRIDTVLLTGKTVCYVEMDTGTETLSTIIDKLWRYEGHNLSLQSQFDSDNESVCFVFRKNRSTLADAPRYTLSKLRILSDFLKSDYVSKRFKLIKDMSGQRLETNLLTENERKICREVIRDIIKNSPLNLEKFEVGDVDEYIRQIENQTSFVYYEDFARMQDRFCMARMVNIEKSFWNEFDRRYFDSLSKPFKAFLLGKEYFFISQPRFHAFLPFIFQQEKILMKGTKSIRDRWEDVLEHNYNYFDRKAYRGGHVLLPEEMESPGYSFCTCVSLRNAYVIRKGDKTHIFFVENLGFDLGARIRILYTRRSLQKPKCDITIVCLVENKDAIKEHNKIYCFDTNQCAKIQYRFISAKELLYSEEPKIYGP